MQKYDKLDCLVLKFKGKIYLTVGWLAALYDMLIIEGYLMLNPVYTVKSFLVLLSKIKNW